MAQHQHLKRKGGADPDHQMSRNHAPPPLSIEVPKMRDLPDKSNPWSDVQLPVDILLLTVEDCEFLACYAFLKNSFKSYDQNLGFVYFGAMGETGEEALKVALMKCYKGSSGPGGSQNVIKNAVMQLRPKASFLVGSCQGIDPEHTKRGDVVVSSKLSTEQFTTPVRRNIGNLILFSAGGWIPPLKDPVGEETVQVHRDSDIFSGRQFITKQRRMSQSRVIAVETEGEGLFAAAQDMNIEWVIVKGISHFSDDSNTPDEPWKSFASIMAASVVSNMLNDPVVFKEWPHYQDLTAKNQQETTTKPAKQMPDSVCLGECQKQLRSLYETSSSKVRIIPWDQNSAVDIDEIYTDLSWVKDHRTPRGVIREKLDHYTKIFADREPRRAPKRILVYGQPGIGKTVFTKKATFDWSQQRYSKTLGEFDLVLLVRLRDVSNLQDVPSILGASEVLDSDGAISVDNLYDYVRRHQEKVLLILDGYDEYVYSSRNESPIFKIWKKSKLRDCCVVITSREMKAETLKSFSDVQIKIDGFNRQRQKEFARRFLKDVRDFFKYLDEHDLTEVAQIPLLLLMLCLLWTKTKREELPKERADIFDQFVKTLFDHLREKQSAESVVVKDYSAELYALGRLAFEALLQGQLYFPVSQLPSYSLIERLIEVGLFQVLNMASLNTEKGVYFIHKSVQEYLAGNFLKKELTYKKAESTNSLLKLDSVEKIRETIEVLKFAAQLSEEAAREIVIHLGMKSGLKEFKFDNETPSQEELSEEQTDFIDLCNKVFFNFSAETRKNLFPTFLSSLGGVLVIDKKQLNVIVKEKLVQTTVKTPNYIFFNESYWYTEQDYSNLIILLQQLNAVIVSSVGEKKASEFLSNLTWRRIDDFFLKKEENNTHLYLAEIFKDAFEDIPFPFDVIKALISKQETTKKTNMNGDESSEESSNSCCSKRHGLSRVRGIKVYRVNRSDVELLSGMMPFITAPQWIRVVGKDGEVYDAELIESLMRSIPTTHNLKILILRVISVTSSPAVEFIDRIFRQAPNLEELDMSWNPLPGAGVDSIIKHLSCAPHLKYLGLYGVMMTPQQVKDLASAAQRPGNITKLRSNYHVNSGKCHSPLSKSLEQALINSCFLLPFAQILAETRLSIDDSPFFAHEQDTVGTFPAPPDPTGKVYCPLPPQVPSSLPSQLQLFRRHISSVISVKEIGRQGLCLFISLFIDKKGILRITTRHEYFTDQALLPHTETKSMLIVRTVTEESSRSYLYFRDRKVLRTFEDRSGMRISLFREHRRSVRGEESTRKGKTKKKHKEGRVTEGDEESPRKKKKRKQHKAHRVTEDGPVLAGAPIIPIECIDPATVWHPSMETSLLIHGLRGSSLFGRGIVTVVLLRS
ncbi:unnamed protein product [Porites evermanni]|uniref:NACHT domain-containing protein n=1 Tax=Porites evermanni TaxID=104178 RepID=A0ABN8S1A0_9CNID|nr:unnamed protein product [Porites evermanni]